MHRTTTAVLVGLGALAVPVAPGLAGTTPSAEPTGPCPDDDGVTVVVDATALGGEVAVGCAPGDPATGTEALVAAGFTETRAESGFICAVDGMPDPCPTEFTGEYWVYFSAEPDGEWVSSQVGSDETDPAPGSVEGWVWSDGAAPSITPPAPGSEVEQPTGTDAADDSEEPATQTPTDEATADAATATDDAGSSTTPLLVALAAVVLVGGAGLVAARRRRDPNGPAGQH